MSLLRALHVRLIVGIFINSCNFDRNYACQHFEIYFLNPFRFVNLSIVFVTHSVRTVSTSILNGEEKMLKLRTVFSDLNILNRDSNSVINFCKCWAYFRVSEGVLFLKCAKYDMLFDNRCLFQILTAFKSINFIKL